MPEKSNSADSDWKADFESVRVQQMLEFSSWTLREKFQAMENMAEVVKAAEAARARKAEQSSKK